MESARTEGSLVASLRELRAIEQQRLADERAAAEVALQAQRDQRAAVERRAREAEAARIAAERSAQLAADAARAEAERQARMRLEAAEAAERARHQAALEERRLGEEMALRREVARRQRPRWMVALTGVAVTAALGLGGFAIQRERESIAVRQAHDIADKAKAEAEAAARQAQEELDRMATELHELEIKVGAAIERVRIASDDAARHAELVNLRQLQRHEAELREQQRQREEDRKRKERGAGVQISDDCLHNVICRK
jgi:hypothetical protein